MDDLEFATLMVEYERMYRQMQDIEEQIKAHVLGLEETQKIAHVTARYSGGRKSYDYEKAGREAPPQLVKEHTKMVKKVDWRKICEDMGLDKEEIPPKSVSEPSVKIVVEF